MQEISAEDLGRLTEKLLREHAVDFRDYKPTSLGRRVQRRLEAVKCSDMECYLKYLDRRPDEYAKLIDSILINVTEFFRDPEAWDILRTEVIPRVVADKHPGEQIRVWSAGCATGEEPYTMAMLLSETVGPRINEYDVRIYATDIDDDALSIARRGEYSPDSLKVVPEAVLQKYFAKNSRYTVNRDVRKMVIFGRHNLVTDPPISHLDLIICRNVLIYMTVDLQNRILSKFYYGLQNNGFLFLGKAESLLTSSKLFSPVNERWRIFRKELAIGALGRPGGEQQAVAQATEAGRTEYQISGIFNEAVLRYTPSGIIVVDNDNVVRVVNSSAEAIWGIEGPALLGKSIFEGKLPPQLQDLLPRISQVRMQRTEMKVEEIDLTQVRNRPLHISLGIAPMFDIMGNSLGIIMVTENITNQVKLRSDLEAVNEQLQAANEEMETTNEELQSTNEELETTNEELQSTNEELETTNEELQSTNEELSTTNDELSVRTTELNTLTFYYNAVIQGLDVPVIIVDEQHIISTWNPAAEQFFGIKASDATKRNFFELNLQPRMARSRDRLRKLPEIRKLSRTPAIEYKTRTGDIAKCVIGYQPLVDSSGTYRGAVIAIWNADAISLEPAAPER